MEDKISDLYIPIQWLKDIVSRNNEFKVDIDEINSYFGGDFFGKDPEVICQVFKDALFKERIYVYLDKDERRIFRLIFTKDNYIFTNYFQEVIKNKISKFQKEISEHIPWLKYEVRLYGELKIVVADLRKNFSGKLFEEDPEIIFRIFQYALSNEGIDTCLCKIGNKYELIFKKSFDDLDNLQHQIDSDKKFINRVPLKPWKDPESLFCDTKFLREFFGKEPRKGKECKDENK